MSIPQDSVLRRHYVSALRMEIVNRLGPRPTDSVLKRHYLSQVDALLRARVDDVQPRTPVSLSDSVTEAFPAPVMEPARTVLPDPPPTATPEPAPVTTPAPSPAHRQADSGGVFGWLRRLFGG